MNRSPIFDSLPEYIKEYYKSEKERKEKERIGAMANEVIKVLDNVPVDECLKILGEVCRILRRE